jgi:DNA-binding response OmpR family regulator
MKSAALRNRRILVIEDDYWVAQVLVDVLAEAGAQVIGPLGWIEEALAFIGSHKDAFDSAVLDLNLHGTKSYPIADALMAQQVPFIFTTGYGTAGIDPPYDEHPRCPKPFNRNALLAALAIRP